MSLADFILLKRIGQGTYSKVYKAKRKSDGKTYALKKIKLDGLKEKEKANALTEVRILASVKHPNIVAFKEVFLEGQNILAVVMEYCNVGDLFSKIQSYRLHKKRFSYAQVWDIFTQIVRGLQALHALNIVHRDLKSANIFLTSRGLVKLGDLNVSKIIGSQMLSTQTGTPFYASPEVWKEQPYDYKSDIWSLGCVLHELLTLSPPFRANDMAELYHQVTHRLIDYNWADISEEFTVILAKLLDLNPQARPTCSQLLELPTVKAHSRPMPETVSNKLLDTIYWPKRTTELAKRLPSPTYRRAMPLSSSPHRLPNSARTLTRRKVFKSPYPGSPMRLAQKLPKLPLSARGEARSPIELRSPIENRHSARRPPRIPRDLT